MLSCFCQNYALLPNNIITGGENDKRSVNWTLISYLISTATHWLHDFSDDHDSWLHTWNHWLSLLSFFYVSRWISYLCQIHYKWLKKLRCKKMYHKFKLIHIIKFEIYLLLWSTYIVVRKYLDIWGHKTFYFFFDKNYL